MKIAVIGGGIVGATTSFYLAQAGDDVTLFDYKIGQATSAAAGIISPWLSQRRNQDWYQLARAGAKFYPTLMTDLNVPLESNIYQQVGTILFKNNQSLLDKLYKIALKRREEAPEIGEISLLTPTEIQTKFPVLTPNMNGLFVSGGARVDGRQLIDQLVRSFKLLGGDYHETLVSDLRPLQSGWLVKTNGMTEEYDKIVLATGAWLPNLLHPLGFSVDVRGQKGQLVEVNIDADTDKWPVVMPQGESDIIPFANGKILIGATHENEQFYDLTVDTQIVTDMVASIKELSPELANSEHLNVRVGTRAYTSDFLPFFGEIAELPGLFVASGLGSSGLTTGPIIGHTMASLLHNEETELKVNRYSPANYIRKI